MTATTTQPRSLSVATIHLAAVLTAVPCARMFVRHTLERWRLKNMVADAELVVSELATNSIRATGITDPEPKWQDIKAHHVLGVQLRVTNNSAFVEIWDRSTISPQPQAQTLDAEGGRGLFLVETLSKKWGVFRPPAGGKVVWAELALTTPDSPPHHHIPLPRRTPGASDPPDGPEKEIASAALMQRMLDGLRGV
ncbi:MULTISPECIES: ATP-binding protein [unclassified Streptomyces]|uniref:ATP-binding protein n=1 Tax=Streptomyces sp. NBC_00060 TaxID=2975636 RepID=A0AAU2GUG4_9ACTN